MLNNSKTIWMSCGTCLLLFLLTNTAKAQDPSTTRPNILIITADNLGYGDLPCFNPDSIVLAPHLDTLATQGARLTSFYTASPTCTVSRACLLTGRIAPRHGLTFQLPGIDGNYGPGLDSRETLIPQVLRSAGYTSGCFGKWNIGFARGSRPTERGFDEFLGHASGNIDYYTHVYNGKHDLFRGVEEAHLSGYATDLFADAACEFIERHTQAEQPWFVYLPFNAPHFPNPRNKAAGAPCVWQAPATAFESYGYDPDSVDERERYRAVITALDTAVGRVMQTLDRLQVADDTFVFFFADNGAFMRPNRGLEVATNAPLREGGVTCWEGGIRVAALARWPGHIPSGVVIDQPLWSPDLFVAVANIASAQLPQNVTLDGLDPLPVLTDGQPSPHKSMFFTYENHAALRMGDWKIVRPQQAEPWQLYNLRHDIGESDNLASDHPDEAAALAAEFMRWQADLP